MALIENTEDTIGKQGLEGDKVDLWLNRLKREIKNEQILALFVPILFIAQFDERYNRRNELDNYFTFSLIVLAEYISLATTSAFLTFGTIELIDKLLSYEQPIAHIDLTFLLSLVARQLVVPVGYLITRIALTRTSNFFKQLLEEVKSVSPPVDYSRIKYQ